MVRFSWFVVLIWRLSTCFAWRPGIGVNKVAKPCINSTWIALLINRFLSVKTWLLITCGTSIYAIIKFSCIIPASPSGISQFSSSGSVLRLYSGFHSTTIFVSLSMLKAVLMLQSFLCERFRIYNEYTYKVCMCLKNRFYMEGCFKLIQ